MATCINQELNNTKGMCWKSKRCKQRKKNRHHPKKPKNRELYNPEQSHKKKHSPGQNNCHNRNSTQTQLKATSLHLKRITSIGNPRNSGRTDTHEAALILDLALTSSIEDHLWSIFDSFFSLDFQFQPKSESSKFLYQTQSLISNKELKSNHYKC